MPEKLILPHNIQCCIVHEGKRALEPGWTLKPKSPEDLVQALNEGHSIGVLCGPFSDDLVIIDLDGFDDEMLTHADAILPPTNFMAGRGKCLTRHRGYKLTDMHFPDEVLPKSGSQTRVAMDRGAYKRFPGKKAFKGTNDGKKFAIEILGAGNQAVIPPSRHPDGQRREWNGGFAGDPATTTYSELIHKVEELFVTLGGKLKRSPSHASIDWDNFWDQNTQPPKMANSSSLLPLVAHQSAPHATDLENFTQAVLNADPAIDGNGGHHHTFYVCCLAGDYNIPPQFAWPVLQDWNKKNKVRWDEPELYRKLCDSYQSGRSSALGSKSISNGHGTYGADSVVNAKIFCEKYYPNEGLLCLDGTYYSYGGLVWKKVPDGTIEHTVQREFEGCLMMGKSVNQPHINNIIRAIKNRAAMPMVLHTPCWLLDPDRDTSGLLIANNTVLEITHTDAFDISVIPHDRSLFSLSHLPYAYDRNAECPKWDAFLAQIWDQHTDNIALLQEWFGYCLIRSYRWQNIMLLVGVSRGGKGVIGRMLQEILGHENACGFTFNSVLGDFGLEEIASKRVAVLGDAQAIDRNKREQAKGILLSISGHDPLPINRKNKPIVTKVVPARLTLLANKMPPFVDNADALSNRLLVIPFSKSFAGQEDTRLWEKLLPERPGILNWALQGLERLMQKGCFTRNATGGKYLQEIRRANNPVSAFLEDCCNYPYSDGFETNDALYCAYTEYMAAINRKGVSDRNTFLSSLRSEAPEAEKAQRRVAGVPKYGYTNIRLKSANNSYRLSLAEMLE